MRYAQIENGNVANIIEASKQGAESLSAYMTLVETDKPIAIGDTYTDNRFYRDGVEILTPYEEMAQFEKSLAEIIDA